MTEEAASVSQAIPNSKGNPLGWRRWVSPEVHNDVTRFMARIFGAGFLASAICGSLYWHFSVSREKLFQFLILIGVLSITFPLLSTSLRMMLLMYYMSWSAQDKSEGMFRNMKELKDESKPILENIGKIVQNLTQVAERHGGKSIPTSLIEEAKDFLVKEGVLQRLDRLTLAIEALGSPTIGAPKKPVGGGLLERGIGRTKTTSPSEGEKSARPDDDTRVLDTVEAHRGKAS